LPNIGGFKALGQLSQGILALPEIATHPQMWPQLVGGIVSGLAGVASTITAPIGVPGWTVGETLIDANVRANVEAGWANITPYDKQDREVMHEGSATIDAALTWLKKHLKVAT
jgi:hypothetical protein